MKQQQALSSSIKKVPCRSVYTTNKGTATSTADVRVFVNTFGMERTTSDVDVDDQLEQMGCKEEFDKVQECMADSNRDWAKCKNVVALWKACFEQQQQQQQQQKK